MKRPGRVTSGKDDILKAHEQQHLNWLVLGSWISANEVSATAAHIGSAQDPI